MHGTFPFGYQREQGDLLGCSTCSTSRAQERPGDENFAIGAETAHEVFSPHMASSVTPGTELYRFIGPEDLVKHISTPASNWEQPIGEEATTRHHEVLVKRMKSYVSAYRHHLTASEYIPRNLRNDILEGMHCPRNVLIFGRWLE